MIPYTDVGSYRFSRRRGGRALVRAGVRQGGPARMGGWAGRRAGGGGGPVRGRVCHFFPIFTGSRLCVSPSPDDGARTGDTRLSMSVGPPSYQSRRLCNPVRWTGASHRTYPLSRTAAARPLRPVAQPLVASQPQHSSVASEGDSAHGRVGGEVVQNRGRDGPRSQYFTPPFGPRAVYTPEVGYYRQLRRGRTRTLPVGEGL